MSKARDLNLQDLLSDLRSEGEVVSSEGDFTIHHSKAEEKLKKFQLSNPHFYILKLVQSAVLSGATQVEVSCQAHQVSLKHDGEPPTPAQLKDLLNYLFVPQQDRTPQVQAMQRLASAVNTAVAAQVRELLIQCHDASSSYQQSWTAAGTKFQELKTAGSKGVEFSLKRRTQEVASSLRHVGDTRMIDLVRGHRSSIQKEEAALWDRCLFSPIPITVNQELISRDYFGSPRFPDHDGKKSQKVPFFHWLSHRGHYHKRLCHKRHHLIQAYHPAQQSDDVYLRAPRAAHSFLLSKLHPHKEGSPCSLILGLEADKALPNRVNFVKEGVLIEQETPDLPVSGLFALLSAQALKTDLSGFHLSRDQEYSKLSERLLGAAEELAREFRERSGELPLGTELITV